MDVKLKPRSSHWFLRFLNNFGGGIAWTTLGDTIYFPDAIEDPYLFPEIIEHEKVHLKQYEQYGTPLFLFLYIFVPLPVFFSYFRWKFEREAYLLEAKLYIEQGRIDVDTIVEEMVKSLWSFYGFVWPKSWMRNWFLKQLKQ